jgi:hypothetical protein
MWWMGNDWTRRGGRVRIRHPSPALIPTMAGRLSSGNVRTWNQCTPPVDPGFRYRDRDHARGYGWSPWVGGPAGKPGS